MKIEQLTAQEVSAFLNKVKPNSTCPFCGSDQLRGELDDVMQDQPMLHDTVKLEFKSQDGHLNPFYKKKQSTQPTIRITCMNCGCVQTFNYWVLQRRIKGDTK
nr:MAG TPA: restriction alleviation protein [Caudoviricetes sp.]